MNFDNLCELAEKLGCEVLHNRKLSEFSTFRVGGECPVIIKINGSEGIRAFIRLCRVENIRYMFLGNGSNVLFDDRGFDGVVFLMDSSYSEIALIDDTTVKVQAGCSLMRLCRFALDNSLTGLEFAYGIPGTVGGAVYMNAGAYGGEIKDIIQAANAVSLDGEIKTFNAEEMKLGYRTSVFQSNGFIVSDAVFKLEKGEKAVISEKMNDLMNRRKSKQPLEFPNAGSTFKRPTGQFAGKLIQDCGLRGMSVGDAQVSEKHCGFVINRGGATSSDVKQLIEKVQQIVLEKTGYFLECEVRVIPYSQE